MTERDRLICRMRLAGHTCAEIQVVLVERGEGLSLNQISTIAKANGIDPGRQVLSERMRTIGRRVAEITPPRPTVANPDGYMARKMKGRVFENVSIRFNRPVHVSEALGRAVERVAANMGERRDDSAS